MTLAEVPVQLCKQPGRTFLGTSAASVVSVRMGATCTTLKLHVNLYWQPRVKLSFRLHHYQGRL